VHFFYSNAFEKTQWFQAFISPQNKNLLSEHFEFRHFRPHYLDVDIIFGDLGVNVYISV
jgi:hypothetical protein